WRTPDPENRQNLTKLIPRRLRPRINFGTNRAAFRGAVLRAPEFGKLGLGQDRGTRFAPAVRLPRGEGSARYGSYADIGDRSRGAGGALWRRSVERAASGLRRHGPDAGDRGRDPGRGASLPAAAIHHDRHRR